MLFSSLTFLYFFLPAVFILYFAVPFRFKNLILLASSLFFYFYGEPVYLAVMVLSTVMTYLFGLWIGHRAKQGRSRKLPMIISVVLSLSLLLFFKYTDFAIDTVNTVFSGSIPLLSIALPIGISFYTFQQISYTVDVYRGDAQVQKNLINYACYVTMFPQLVAGPIVRYTVIEKALRSREHSFEKFSQGAFRFTVGLGKKVLIANTLAELTDKFAATEEKTVLFCWMYAIAYALQVYFDFSGYSDMAIGLGRIFGFEFMENFNYPFISKSISEFWRRWHISLGSWFRDYIYIPMGGNRVKLSRWAVNIFTVWFLTGLWHGASWNFVLWGLYFGVLLAVEKMFLGKFLDRLPAVFRHIYVTFFIIISFVLFSSVDLSNFVMCIKGMFGGMPLASQESIYLLKSYAVVLITALIGATPLVKNAVLGLSKWKGGEKAVLILRPICLFVLLTVSTAFLVDGSFNPFLYFRF